MSDRIPTSQIDQDDSCSNCPPIPENFSKNYELPKASLGARGKEVCSWFEVHYLMRELGSQLKLRDRKFQCILAISTGGIIPAKLLAEELGIFDIRLIPIRNKQVDSSNLPRLDKGLRYVIVDDIFDTGKTSKMVSEILEGYDFEFAFCMTRYPGCPGISGRTLNHDRWIVFPWEKES